jgi:WD40 repeat protein/uncharacterized caspase-like protein
MSRRFSKRNVYFRVRCRTRLLVHALLFLLACQNGSEVAATQRIQVKNVEINSIASQIEFETVVQSGHPGIGELMVFDSSGEYLAVSSRMSLDTTVWHIPTRTMIRRFRSHRTIYDQPKRLQLIENPVAVVLTSSRMVERWNISDGQRMEIKLRPPGFRNGGLVDTPEDSLSCFAISDTRTWQAHARIENDTVESGVLSQDRKTVFRLGDPLINPGTPYGFAFSPDDRHVIQQEWNRIRVIDFAKRQVIKDINVQELALASVKFSPGGQYLVANARRDGDPIIIVFDVVSGLKVFEKPALPFSTLAISANSKCILSTSKRDNAYFLVSTDIATGQSHDLFEVNGFATGVAVAPASDLVALTSADLAGLPSIDLWHMKTGTRIGELRNFMNPTSNILVDALSAKLIASYPDGSQSLWDLKEIKQKALLRKNRSPVVAARNGRCLKAGVYLGKRVLEWAPYEDDDQEVKSNRFELIEHKFGQPNPVCASRDLSFAVVANDTLLNVVERKTKTVQKIVRPADASAIQIVEISDDGEDLMFADAAGLAEWWRKDDAGDYQQVAKKQGFVSQVYEESTSIKGIVATNKGFSLCSELGTALFYENGTSNPIVNGPCDSLVQAPDGEVIAWVNLSKNAVQVFDLQANSIVKTVPLGKKPILRIKFGVNKNEMFVLKLDGSVDLWRMNPIRKVLSLHSANSGSLVASTADGFFKSDFRSIGSLAFRNKQQMYRAEQLDLEKNRPDVLLERASYADKKMIQQYKLVTQWRRRNRSSQALNFSEQVELKFAATPQSVIECDMLSLKLEFISDQVKQLRFRINNVPVSPVESKTDPGLSNREYRTVKLKLLSGKNSIEIVAEGADGLLSLPLLHIANSIQEEPVAKTWLVSIGVGDYSDKGKNLRYAAKDAVDIERALRNNHSGPFESLVLNTPESNKPTEVISRIAKFLLQADINDTVILFLAGHGVIHEGSYELALYDYDFKASKGGTLSFNDLEDKLSLLKARKRVVLVDSCHAGDRLPSEKTKIADAGQIKKELRTRSSLDIPNAPPTSPSIREIFVESFTSQIGRSGAIVLAASDASRFALESERWKNGAFTFVLREAIEQHLADANKDRQITVSELDQYLRTRVPELTSGQQLPQQKRRNVEIDPVIATW